MPTASCSEVGLLNIVDALRLLKSLARKIMDAVERGMPKSKAVQLKLLQSAVRRYFLIL